MLETLHRLFARDADPAGAASGADVPLAACALLLELAHADGEFTEGERAQIAAAMARQFALDGTAVAALMAEAEAARRTSVDHFQFTRQLNARLDLAQKVVLAEIMWSVVLADGQLAEHERYLVRKLANLLEVEPGFLAQARQRASDGG
ncbi:MAG: TerB family tellurite resistance protein [Gemmatimonadales bacterium]|nr:TerB family tellurite resistance protein [Gemmatimonadales bacterium]